MKNDLLKLIAAAIVLVVGVTAAQALTTAGPHRPATVPADYVITPFGYFHPSCVGRVASGDELLPDQGVIRHADGTTLPMHVCAYPHYRGDGTQVVGDERNVTDPEIGHSWIVDEAVTTSSAYGFLSGLWTVPPAPGSNDGQTLYYFNGLEQSKNDVSIIQPVLGWNSDYASEWGAASWNCCYGNGVWEATPVPVNSGDTILGYMFNNCSSGTKTCGSWDIITWDLSTDGFSQLTGSSNLGQTFNWAFGGVLEVYNIAQCSDYPDNPYGWTGGLHDISFNQIVLWNDKLQSITPAWALSKDDKTGSPQCNYGGLTPKQIILTYGSGTPGTE
jgi:hypothetical protein